MRGSAQLMGELGTPLEHQCQKSLRRQHMGRCWSPVRRLDLATTIFTSFKQIIGQVPEGGRMSVAQTKALRQWLLRLATLPGLGGFSNEGGALTAMIAAVDAGSYSQST